MLEQQVKVGDTIWLDLPQKADVDGPTFGWVVIEKALDFDSDVWSLKE